MSENEMVERVARASIAASLEAGRVPCACMGPEPDDPVCRCRMRLARIEARAAIEAMREPITKEMVVAAETALENATDSDYDSGPDGESRNWYETKRPGWEFQIWRAMIDAALSPNGKRGVEG